MAINGTANADTLWGTLGGDVIDALGGNDTIHGSQGTDSVNGGTGVDRLVFTLADATLFTAATGVRSYTIGASTVTDSSALLNTSFSAVENITFSTIGAGDFDDTINGSGFNGTGLTVALGNGNATVTGSAKVDIINTGRGDNVINAGLGNDNIIASHGTDTLNGNGGIDRVTLNMFNTNVFDAATGSRTYTITTASLSDSSGTLNSTMSDIERITIDTRFTGNFGETIDASGFVTAATTATVLNATTGDGNDTVTGTAYRDFIQTGLGDDIINGGAGDDFLFVGLGTNTVDGGVGVDEVSFIFANNSSDTLYLTQAGATITATLGGVVINTISNAEFLSAIYADENAAETRVDASGIAAGALTQLGFRDHNGSDILVGSHGADFFSNGTNYTAGNDVYTGNGGADIFDYTFAVNGMDGDTITDFDADDVIDLQFNNSTQNGGVGLLANQFIGSAAFSNVAGQYRYFASGGQTFVQVDTSGDGVADETLTIANGQFALGETIVNSNQLQIVGISGTSGNDFLVGTMGNDQIYAQGGNDTIAATGGMDHNYGGDGYDELRLIMSDASRFDAAYGSRTYTVGAGWIGTNVGVINTYYYDVESIFLNTRNTGDYGDTVDGSASSAALIMRLGHGNDSVTGSANNDDIASGLGFNTVDAGGGFDTVYLQNDNSLPGTIFVTSVDGAVVTTLDGVVTNTVTNAEQVAIYGFHADFATTADASDLTGYSGTVIFWDNNGSNISIGWAGSDIFANIHGYEAGNDVYTGNGGADVYDYTWAVGAMDGDTITDFDTDDVIDLSHNTVFQNSGLLADQFIGTAAFSNIAGQYRYFASGGQTLVEADTNGDGVADETLTIANGEYGLVQTEAGSNILMRANLLIDNANEGFLVGDAGNDVILMLDGNDFIAATQGIDFVDGGEGYDQLRFLMANTGRFSTPIGSRTYTVTGDHVADSSGMLNTSFTNVEQVYLSTVNAGDFGDIIDGSGASVSLALRLGNGNDTVTGGAGDDDITTGLGFNNVDAGDGYDLVVGQYDNTSGATAYVTFDGSAVITTANGIATNSVSNAELVGVQGSDFNAAVTTVDASELVGFSGQLIFWDHNGTNISIGSAGSDIFANVHGGEAGNDVYTGNGGADVYDYTWAVGAMNGDTITDLDADDVIDFMYNNATQNGGGLLAILFIGASNFTGVAGQYRYFASGGQTFVQADTNGDGVADETLTISNSQFALGETFAGSNILKVIGTSGTSGNNTLHTTLGNDRVYAQGGNDMIFASQGTDFVDGGAGSGDRLVFLTFDASKITPATGSRNYVISANSVTDSSGLINTSFAGIERVNINSVGGGDFGDSIDASGFVTNPNIGTVVVLTLGNGNDTVIGSAYSDSIFTGQGSNFVDAGGGYDYVQTQDNMALGTQFVTGSGNTLITTQNGVATNTILNAEFVSVGVDSTNPFVADGITYIVDASAYTGAAQLQFFDHNGDDLFIGSSGADIFSNLYNATIGNDTYTGNGGADIYDYTVAINALNNDVITDFDSDDIIDFQFNDGIVAGQLRCQFWIGSAAFSGVVGQYRYEASGGQTYIQIDTNGDAVADRVLTISNGQFAIGETVAGSNQLHIIGLSGTSGQDTLTGTLGDDSIYAQAATDIINGSQGTDYIDGGNGGGDRLFMNTGTASLFTAATGSRTYTIGHGSITDSSGTVNTTFTAVERIAFSTVGNGDFDDVIDASGYVSGHSLALDIRLGNGDNQVVGSSTNERVFTGFGSNIVDGGSGGYDHGFINVDAASDVTITIGNVGGVLVTQANGTVNQFSNYDEVWVQGVGAGVVTLDASAYTDIAGLALILVGHNGSDIMTGSSGNDYFANITGQVLGNDVYTGNGGEDIYDYTWAADSMNGDTITDFDIDDVIDFQFNNLEAFGSPILCNLFIGADPFSGVAGEYRYQINGTQTVVQVDSNGDTIVDQTLTITNGGFNLAETFAGSNILSLAESIDVEAGLTIDGYLAGATVFIDTDGDLTLDAGEAWTTTEADGSFVLSTNQQGTLVAFGGINTDTNLANTMTLAAPDNSGIISPLTTLIQAVMEQPVAPGDEPLTADQAQDLVLAALGLDPDIDLLNLDLIAAAATDPAAFEAQQAAAMIANLVSSAKGAEGAVDGTEGLLVDALADLVTGGGGTIDLTDSATLTPLLTVALPDSDDVSAIVTEVAFEGDAIAAATSIDEISDAQLDANIFNHIAGGSGSDTLTGTGTRDRIIGGDGKDFLRGGGGDDLFVAEFPQTKLPTKLGNMSVDVIFDFSAGDKIDVSGIDANGSKSGHPQFSWKDSNANKAAGDLSYKSYTSVQGAEKALGIDIDGVAGPSPYSGPVTIVYGNVDGGTPDFAIVLIGVNSLSSSDFMFVS